MFKILDDSANFLNMEKAHIIKNKTRAVILRTVKLNAGLLRIARPKILYEIISEKRNRINLIISIALSLIQTNAILLLL